jgi:hypothetical protein
MSYIKYSITTARDIMESPLGKVVLDFEIGKCPAYYLRGLLSTWLTDKTQEPKL